MTSATLNRRWHMPATWQCAAQSFFVFRLSTLSRFAMLRGPSERIRKKIPLGPILPGEEETAQLFGSEIL